MPEDEFGLIPQRELEERYEIAIPPKSRFVVTADGAIWKAEYGKWRKLDGDDQG